MTTYTELLAQIRDYTETDSAVLTDAICNDFIEHAEIRIFKDVDLDCYKFVANGATAADNRWVPLPGQDANEETPRLSDFTTVRYVTLYLDSGTKKRYPLNKVDADFMNEYYDTPETGSTSVPKYYGMWDQGTLVLAPTPNAIYKFEVGFTKLPTGLSSSNAENWVSVNAPRTLLYACLCEAFKFLKAPQNQQVYEQSYRESITALAQEQMGKKRRDEYRDGAIRIPIPSANP